MTLRKSSYRKRKQSGTDAIPRSIKEWFAGERAFTFFAYSYPYAAYLPEYWAAWLEDHPGAVMPEALPRLIKAAAGKKRMLANQKDDD